MSSQLKIVERVKDGISVLQMNLHLMKNVFEREDSFKWAVIFLAFPVVANTLLAALSFPSGFGSIFSKFVFWPIAVPFMSLALSFVALAFFVEKNFKTKLEWKKLFGLLGSASIVFSLSILVFLVNAVGFMDLSDLFSLIWLGGIVLVFFVAYNFLTKILGLSHKDALISVFAGVVFLFLVQILLGKIFVGNYYRIFY